MKKIEDGEDALYLGMRMNAIVVDPGILGSQKVGRLFSAVSRTVSRIPRKETVPAK